MLCPARALAVAAARADAARRLCTPAPPASSAPARPQADSEPPSTATAAAAGGGSGEDGVGKWCFHERLDIGFRQKAYVGILWFGLVFLIPLLERAKDSESQKICKLKQVTSS